MNLAWEKLSPNEFTLLLKYVKKTKNKLEDVTDSLGKPGLLYEYPITGEMDLAGFKKFLRTYLGKDVEEELIRHVFVTFSRCKRAGVKITTSRISVYTDPATLHGEEATSMMAEQHPMIQLSKPSIQTKSAEPKEQSQMVVVDDENEISVVLDDNSVPSGDEPSTKESVEQKPSDSSSTAPSAAEGKLEDIDDVVKVSVPCDKVVKFFELLEGGSTAQKLEFVFMIYDTDGDGLLNQKELSSVNHQMLSIAHYVGWDTNKLKSLIPQIVALMDTNGDGKVSLSEWISAGTTYLPLLVLMGLENTWREHGEHTWRSRKFKRPVFCNVCKLEVGGVADRGYICNYCKFIVHEGCVHQSPYNCISTFLKYYPVPKEELGLHHWVEGNCTGLCSSCNKTMKTNSNAINGFHCPWCHIQVHNECIGNVNKKCDFCELRPHILPPRAIIPTVFLLDKIDRSPSSNVANSTDSSNTMSQTEDNEEGQNHTGNSSSPNSLHMTPMDNTNPLLVFINPKSGGRQGPKLFRQFQSLLNPRQVYDMTDGGPSQALQTYKDLQDIKIICCGGDGTVGWLLDSMDKINYETQPPVGVIPLGTGNDLARCLRWGGGYEGESLPKLLQKMHRASLVMMDRWSIHVSDVDSSQPGDPMPYNIINNYFSFGVDASICMKFHTTREKHPDKFNSRIRNKIWYFEFGMSEQLASSCKNLQRDVEIECDGTVLDLSKGSSLQGIALLNIPFTHGGTNMWGEKLSKQRVKRHKRKKRERDLSVAFQDIGDKLIEVVGFENCLHMSQVRTGLRASGKRLAQCSTVVIKTKRKFPMQIDGEPWMQPPCTIKIEHKNQVPMLMGPPEKKGLLSVFKEEGQ